MEDEIKKMQSQVVYLLNSVTRIENILKMKERNDKIILSNIHERLKLLEKRCDEHIKVGFECPHVTKD